MITPKPTERLKKIWPAAVCLVVPMFAVNASAMYWSSVIGERLPPYELFLATAHAAAFALAFLLLTTWVSVQVRVQAHVAFWAGGFVITQVAQYFIPGARLFSVFRFSDFDLYSPVLAGNHGLFALFVPGETWAPSLWLCLAIVGLYWFAARQFARLEL